MNQNVTIFQKLVSMTVCDVLLRISVSPIFLCDKLRKTTG